MKSFLYKVNIDYEIASIIVNESFLRNYKNEALLRRLSSVTERLLVIWSKDHDNIMHVLMNAEYGKREIYNETMQ